ncbi:MAG: DUF1223 domain-containing protein [Cephaloticoccus sp.]|nr:DUF1223 domain-containing protein [Cephaloticoccus sp.]MCF7760641.1 DUF1223 domain-containing protein [Cephaloticoccus sp.]
MATPLIQAEQTFSSGTVQVALLELFTSEGCSSCPPVEQWLGHYRDDPALWLEVVPVAWHVNYWDRLGWKDRYATREFTARQYAYASVWRSNSVYTPCLVRNGLEWRQGGTIRPAATKAGQLTVVWSGSGLALVRFTPPPDSSPDDYTVTIALLGGSISSQVQKGENAGRELHHEFVALRTVEAGLTRDGEEGYVTSITLPYSNLTSTPRQAVAAWVTRSGELAPLQATGGWLN